MQYYCPECEKKKINLIIDETALNKDNADGSSGKYCYFHKNSIKYIPTKKKPPSQNIVPAIHFKGEGWPSKDIKNQKLLQARLRPPSRM